MSYDRPPLPAGGMCETLACKLHARFGEWPNWLTPMLLGAYGNAIIPHRMLQASRQWRMHYKKHGMLIGREPSYDRYLLDRGVVAISKSPKPKKKKVRAVNWRNPKHVDHLTMMLPTPDTEEVPT